MTVTLTNGGNADPLVFELDVNGTPAFSNPTTTWGNGPGTGTSWGISSPSGNRTESILSVTRSQIGSGAVSFGNVDISFNVSAVAPRGDTVNYTVQGLPGSATFTNQVFTWDIAADAIPGGLAQQMTFVATDATTGLTAQWNVLVVVNEFISLGGQAMSWSHPYVADDSFTYTGNGAAQDLLLDDWDPPSITDYYSKTYPISVVSGSGPADGTLGYDSYNGELTYTPNPGFVGVDQFQYVKTYRRLRVL